MKSNIDCFIISLSFHLRMGNVSVQIFLRSQKGAQMSSGHSIQTNAIYSVCINYRITWPPRSQDLTVCDFFLWGFIKGNVYVPPPPKTLPELQECINTAIRNIAHNMLERIWWEWEYHPVICHVTHGVHIECI
jgi:hypothetical protein